MAQPYPLGGLRLMDGNGNPLTSTSGALDVHLAAQSGQTFTITEEFAFGDDPPAPDTGFILYCVFDVGGKRNAAVRFPTGSPQLFATEP